MQASLTRTSQKGGLIEFTRSFDSLNGTVVVPELIGKSGLALLALSTTTTYAISCFTYVSASRRQGRRDDGDTLYAPLFDSETGTLTLNGRLMGTYLIQAW